MIKCIAIGLQSLYNKKFTLKISDGTVCRNRQQKRRGERVEAADGALTH